MGKENDFDGVTMYLNGRPVGFGKLVVPSYECKVTGEAGVKAPDGFSVSGSFEIKRPVDEEREYKEKNRQRVIRQIFYHYRKSRKAKSDSFRAHHLRRLQELFSLLHLCSFNPAKWGWPPDEMF
jgi:hypothetical protein